MLPHTLLEGQNCNFRILLKCNISNAVLGIRCVFDFGVFNLLREPLLPWHENTIIKAHFIILVFLFFFLFSFFSFFFFFSFYFLFIFVWGLKI